MLSRRHLPTAVALHQKTVWEAEQELVIVIKIARIGWDS